MSTPAVLAFMGQIDSHGMSVVFWCEDRLYSVGQWWEMRGYPPLGPVGWNGASYMERWTLAVAMLDAIGWPTSDAGWAVLAVANEVLANLPPGKWEIQNFELVGFLNARDLLLRLTAESRSARFAAPSRN